MGRDNAREAGQNWTNDYNALLMSFDKSAVREALLAFCITEQSLVGMTEDQIYAVLCIAFTKLYQRGAIAPIRPLSTEGERQLKEITTGFNVVVSEPERDPAEAENLSLQEQVVRDFQTLPSHEFNRKVMAKDPAYREAFEQADQRGLIEFAKKENRDATT